MTDSELASLFDELADCLGPELVAEASLLQPERPLATPPLPQLEPASPPRGEYTVKIYFVILTNIL